MHMITMYDQDGTAHQVNPEQQRSLSRKGWTLSAPSKASIAKIKQEEADAAEAKAKKEREEADAAKAEAEKEEKEAEEAEAKAAEAKAAANKSAPIKKKKKVAKIKK